MPLSNYFKDQDQLGSSVSINFKGKSGFGTMLGGIISLIVTLFVALFVIVQLYAWLFSPSYN